MPFYDAEELTHQFERLTSEEEGLLKERRAAAEEVARKRRDARPPLDIIQDDLPTDLQ